MGKHLEWLCGAGVAVALLAAGAAQGQISVGGPGVDPADFRITVFASGLSYPTSLQRLDDGSLLVLTNDPSSGLFDSVGEIVRLVDADDDGVADAAPQLLYTGLPGVATSLRRWNTLLFVSSREIGNETISVLRLGAAPGDPLTLLGELEFAFPVPGIIQNHRNVALAVRPVDGASDRVHLLWNVGSEASGSATIDTVDGAGLLAGLPGATGMAMDAIWRVTVQDTGGVPVLSDLVQIAAGLRNAAGIAFDADGDLWFEDNGMDGLPVKSADELNRIAAADVGGAIEDFGFPVDFVEYQTGTLGTGLSIQPEVVFQPIPDPLTGAQSEGPVEIAFSPPFFPSALQGGLFIGFHGGFSQAGVANDENPVVFVDLATGDYFHFVSVTESAIGHPNGLLATPRSLFIADLTSGGSIFSNGANGVIHQIQVVPGAQGIPVPLGGAVLGSFALLAAALVYSGLRARSRTATRNTIVATTMARRHIP